MAYHAATSNVVLFGGGEYGDEGDLTRNDTWTWDRRARTWAKQKPLNRPCPRFYGAMAYHAPTASAVIFGAQRGCDGASTWAWNGVNWKRRA